MRFAALITTAAVTAATTLAACGDGQPWKGDAGRSDADAVSVAPAATSVPDEPPRASTPGDAPSPAGTNPDGSTIGTTAPDAVSDAVREDRAAMLIVRTTVSIIEGCHSGRPSYADCDEQRELGARDALGVVLGTSPGQAIVAATPQSLRVTVRSRSGARFTVARSPKGDRFSCAPGPQPGACPDTRTWNW